MKVKIKKNLIILTWLVLLSKQTNQTDLLYVESFYEYNIIEFYKFWDPVQIELQTCQCECDYEPVQSEDKNEYKCENSSPHLTCTIKKKSKTDYCNGTALITCILKISTRHEYIFYKVDNQQTYHSYTATDCKTEEKNNEHNECLAHVLINIDQFIFHDQVYKQSPMFNQPPIKNLSTNKFYSKKPNVLPKIVWLGDFLNEDKETDLSKFGWFKLDYETVRNESIRALSSKINFGVAICSNYSDWRVNAKGTVNVNAKQDTTVKNIETIEDLSVKLNVTDFHVHPVEGEESFKMEIFYNFPMKAEKCKGIGFGETFAYSETKTKCVGYNFNSIVNEDSSKVEIISDHKTLEGILQKNWSVTFNDGNIQGYRRENWLCIRNNSNQYLRITCSPILFQLSISNEMQNSPSSLIMAVGTVVLVVVIAIILIILAIVFVRRNKHKNNRSGNSRNDSRKYSSASGINTCPGSPVNINSPSNVTFTNDKNSVDRIEQQIHFEQQTELLGPQHSTQND